jgi:hypothetical protein
MVRELSLTPIAAAVRQIEVTFVTVDLHFTTQLTERLLVLPRSRFPIQMHGSGIHKSVGNNSRLFRMGNGRASGEKT